MPTLELNRWQMRIIHCFVGLVIFVMVGSVSAQWRENGKEVTDTAWRKAWGQYGVMLQLTNKPDELFAMWEKPSAGVPVTSTEVAKRGEPIVGVVFFTGCTANKSGFCDTEAYFQVLKPDGSAYGAEERGELWSGKPPPPEGQLQLSVGAIGAIIEPNDPNGTYTIRARLRDNVSQAEVELTRTFVVNP